jgi:hypothetical protein
MDSVAIYLTPKPYLYAITGPNFRGVGAIGYIRLIGIRIGIWL